MAEYIESGTMLSNGTINATIDTYKPKDVTFISGGTITIVFDGNTIATIHVTEDSNPKTVSKYILTGNTRSLTMFDILCNKDITDKSPYLIFNGKPAIIPDDFEVKEKDGTTFTPPQEISKAEKDSIKAGIQSQRRYEMNSILESLEEAEREPTSGESGAAEGPLKTIYLLVSMHGARLETMPLSLDLPINETYAYAPGKCPILKVSTIDQLTRIKKYRTLRTDEIVSEYSRDLSLKAKEEIDRYSVLYDHHYQCDDLNNANVFSNGIFILGSTFLDRALNPVELGDRMHVEYSQFPTAQYEMRSAMELQKINLINIHVLEELSRRVTGKPFGLEHLTKDPYFSITNNDTGLPHYFDSKLSHYLRYCQRLGAEKVVLLDETCRIRSFRQGVGAEERAAAEELGYGPVISRPYTPGEMRKPRIGGKRTRRRRRSRRSHKKS